LSKSIKYSVVVPVYHSSESLFELANGVEEVFSHIDEEFELIFINDSWNNKPTVAALDQLDSRPYVRVITLMRNFGQPAAILCGFKYSKGDYVITMDDDLQHSPGDIPKLIEMQDHDLVIAAFDQKKHRWNRNLWSRIKSWFDYKFIRKPRHIYNSPFRLIKKEVIDAALRVRTSHPFIAALLYYATDDVVNVEVEHKSRKYGKSGYSFYSLLKHFSNLLFNNTSFALRLVSYLGVLIVSVSFLSMIYLVTRRIMIEQMPAGWTSIMVVLLFIGGVIMFSLGIIGEYLLRIITGVERKPAYLVRSVTKK